MDDMNNPVYKTNKRNLAFEASALALGMISIATCACLYSSLICGALAIIFAVLSKGGEGTMSQRARLAMWIGIAGLALTIIMYAFAFYSAISQYGSIENILRAYSDMTGQDFEALFPELAQ